MNVGTERGTEASTRSTANNIEDNKANNKKDEAKMSGKSGKVNPEKSSKTNDNTEAGQAQGQSANKAKPKAKANTKVKVKKNSRLDGIEKLLMQMHRDNREQRKVMDARLEKLEKTDYQGMPYDNDGEGSSGQYEGYGYYNNQYGDQANSNSNEHQDDEQASEPADDNISGSDLIPDTNAKDASLTLIPNPNPKKKITLGFASKFVDVEEVGPPVDETMAKELDDMLSRKLQDSKIADCLAQYLTPSNLPRLKTPKVNPPIWETLSPKTKSFDVRLQRVQTSLNRGLCAFVHSIDGTPSPEQEQAMALMCNANYELNVARKDHIKPELNSAFAHLCKKPTGIDSLFGDDLQKYVKDISDEKKAVMACTKPWKKNYGSGPNYRGQRFQPYMRYNNPRRGQNRSFLGNRGGQNQAYYPQYQRQQGSSFQRGRGRGKAPSTVTRPSQ